MDRKVIVILDAFRWDYISKNQTPFLYNFKEQNLYIQNLVPSPGFCERSEIFTGLNPKKSGNLQHLQLGIGRLPKFVFGLFLAGAKNEVK